MAPPAGPRPPGYGGPEETSEVRRQRKRAATHPGLPLDQRMMIAEERAAAAEEVATAVAVAGAALSNKFDTLTKAVERLTHTLDGQHKLEDGINWKVTELYNLKRILVRVAISVLTAAVIGAGTWIMLLYRGGK